MTATNFTAATRFPWFETAKKVPTSNTIGNIYEIIPNKPKSGGGLIGGGLSHMLCSGFGVIGAYVIDVIVLIISLVLINGNALNLSVHSALLFPLLTLFSSHFNTFSVTFIADFGRLIHPAPTFLHATKCRSLRDEYKRDNEYDIK